MSRFKAAGIHLLLTCLIATIAICVMVFVWYPPPLFQLLGGFGLLMLISGCDIVIGPLLTFVVFKSGKRGMKFDLAVIAILQATALAYGIYIMAVARPVFIVFVKDRFELTSIADIQPARWEKATDARFKHAPWTGPEFIGVKWPTDRAEQQKLFDMAFQGADVHTLPEYYSAYDVMAAEVAAKSQPIQELKRLNYSKSAQIDEMIVALGLKENDVGFLPVNHLRGAITVLVRRDNGAVLKLVKLNPWEL
ncbi:MAG: TfpX/TfpZ family type IV pilin accessory protein [Betaproteobacteria bacterium]